MVRPSPPMTRAHRSPAAGGESAIDFEERPLVLAVDDDPALLRMVRLVLEAGGFETTVAADGDDALALARDRRPDLALVDLRMPGISGFDLIPRIREMGVPVLVLTASGNPDDRARARGLGAADYIAKPFDPEDLVRRLRFALHKPPQDS